jgi:hypothetical protein
MKKDLGALVNATSKKISAKKKQKMFNLLSILLLVLLLAHPLNLWWT